MTVIVVDNYDSFTYNLVQLILANTSDTVVVLRNDDRDAWSNAERAGIDAVVVSPGPGRPDVATDFGISADAIRSGLPVLGVCLGHQGLCYIEGGRIDPAPEPMHGRVSEIVHDGSALFEGIPSPFAVVRYHSLCVGGVPESLDVTAWTTTSAGRRVVMAVQHRDRPAFGVQFHPESLITSYGTQLIQNFLRLSGIRLGRGTGAVSVAKDRPRPLATGPKTAANSPLPKSPWTESLRLVRRRVDVEPSTDALYERVFAGADKSFWLDSSSVVSGQSRFSILGCAGPNSEYVTSYARQGVEVRNKEQQAVHYDIDVFTYLEQRLAALRLPAFADSSTEFNLGYVGYLAYELKAECGGDAAHRTDVPDAALLLCDRAVVVDHRDGVTHALTLVPDVDLASAQTWLDEMVAAVADCASEDLVCALDAPATPSLPGVQRLMPLVSRDSPENYAKLVQSCLREIVAGETYEVCLTTMFETERPRDSLHTYRDLRRLNPVPFGALLRFGGVEVLSASPERFLSIDTSGRVEAKPIKGTRPRGRDEQEDSAYIADLRSCEKDRAENLMIVDLLRNDLGRVSEVGSVHVPVLFDVETYATVHQLVSTVRSQLCAEIPPVRCVQAAFPGGSMTGAPKRRTMQIIDRLEGSGRGVYSGAIGYFALSGAVDLSIVIRTIVLVGDKARVGAGGAIVALSDPDDEVAEMHLKARAPLDALWVQAEPKSAGNYRREAS